MFLQKFDVVSGKQEWHCTENDTGEIDDMKNEIARSTYAGMLHDSERNIKYNLSIKEAVKEMHNRGHEAKVLDIGTGTGILAMMAARNNADKVVACEVFQPMAKIAQEVIDINGYSDVINVVAKRSTEMHVGEGLDMDCKANVLVTEIFDTELLGEGVLPTLRHAQKNLTEPDSITIPSSAKVFITVGESYSLWKSHKLCNLKLHNGRRLKAMQHIKDCQGLASAFELHVDEVDDLKPLSKSVEAIRFDFNKTEELEEHEDGLYNSHRVEVKVTASGTIHCIVLWWEIILDKTGSISLSMIPKLFSDDADMVKWRDHWMQAVYFLPEEMSVHKGDVIDVTIRYDDYSFWFITRPLISCLPDMTSTRPSCTCGLHTTWSRERFLMNNDPQFNKMFASTFQKLKESNHCAIIGDLSLVPFSAAQFFKKITYIECGQFSRGFLEKLISLNQLTDRISTISIQSVPDESLLALSSIDQVDVLAAEPFFSSSRLPWDHFTFWYQISPILMNVAKVPIVIPAKAILKVVAVEFQDLWKVRSQVKEVEGFNLSVFDEVIEAALVPEKMDDGGYLFEAEPYSLWEYKHTLLSDIEEVAVFNFTEPVPVDDIIFQGHLKGTLNGKFNGLVAWIDFCLDEENVWTTGLMNSESKWVRYSKQGVLLISEPYTVTPGNNIDYHIVFESKTGTILFRLANNPS